jgi:hypothetical protein
MFVGQQDMLRGFFRRGFLLLGSRRGQTRPAYRQQREQYGQQKTKHDITLPFTLLHIIPYFSAYYFAEVVPQNGDDKCPLFQYIYGSENVKRK